MIQLDGRTANNLPNAAGTDSGGVNEYRFHWLTLSDNVVPLWPATKQFQIIQNVLSSRLICCTCLLKKIAIAAEVQNVAKKAYTNVFACKSLH